MDLFNKLYNHRRDQSLENYFTDIVAYLFQNNHDLLFSWIRELEHKLKLESDTYTSVQVESQVRFDESRPDILIKLHKGNELDVVMVEAKIESGEHHDQLIRYAGILKHEFPKARQRILVFITRYYEPKDAELISGNDTGVVEFIQLRWHDFYHLLKKQPLDHLTQDVITFMEVRGMAQSNQFKNTDVETMSNLINLYSLMNASLADDVFQMFQTVAKERVSPRPELHHEFYYYMLTCKLRDESIRWLGIGYNLGNSPEVPEAAIEFQINPESRYKDKFLPALRTLVDNYHWIIRCWDGDPSIEEEGNWIDVNFTKKLDDFLTEENNLNDIKKFFIDRMEELIKVQKLYPKLPWNK